MYISKRLCSCAIWVLWRKFNGLCTRSLGKPGYLLDISDVIVKYNVVRKLAPPTLWAEVITKRKVETFGDTSGN